MTTAPKRFKPKDGERYWTYDFDLGRVGAVLWVDQSWLAKTMLDNYNCFRTEAEAVAHRDWYLAQCKERYGE